MSVPSTYTPAQYNCNGSTTEFPFTFGVNETSEIEVILSTSAGVETTLTETTDYTVSAVNNDYSSGGTVTTVATYAEGYTITVRRNVPLTQDTDFTENMPTLYESFEDGLDKLTRIAQQVAEEQSRMLIVPKTEDTTVSKELPSASARANKYLSFDSSGEPVATASVAEGTISLTTFSNALLECEDAGEAQDLIETYSTTEVDAAIAASAATVTASVANSLSFKNLSLAASVSAKALTIAVKGVDGNDPSATNKVTIPFRSATVTSGLMVLRELSAALSMTLSAGSTVGFSAAEVGRVYFGVIDNAGTLEAAIAGTAVPFREDGLVSTTAEGGIGAADDGYTLYSASARTNVACRLLGFVDITTGATAGEWDNAATKIQVMGPGVKRTGDIVQSYYMVKTDTQTASATAWTAITDLAKTITPTSAANKIRLKAVVNVGANAQAYVSIRFTKAGSAIGVPATAGNRILASGHAEIGGAGQIHPAVAFYEDSPATTSATAYAVEFYENSVIPHVNRTGTDTDSAAYQRTISTLIVEEVMR